MLHFVRLFNLRGNALILCSSTNSGHRMELHTFKNVSILSVVWCDYHWSIQYCQGKDLYGEKSKSHEN